jgi:hypothetical protein
MTGMRATADRNRLVGNSTAVAVPVDACLDLSEIVETVRVAARLRAA